MKGGRVGLFVGISPYENYNLLPGASQDATLLADAFKQQYGFIARTVPDDPGTADNPKPVGSDRLRSAVNDFRVEIAKASLALIYVAAHGVSDGERKSYIISSSANPLRTGDAEELRLLLYPADYLFDCLEACAGYRILILDCCRTNPQRKGEERPNVNVGVAVPRTLKRGIVVQSTQHDAAAHEKHGRGLFAGVLAEEIRSGRHRKAINLFQAVQNRLDERSPDDEKTRDFASRQSVAIEPGSRSGEILLADESERYAQAQLDHPIALAGNVTALSSSGSERTLAVATNQVWRSLKAHEQAAPEGRERAGDPTLRFYRREEGSWRKTAEAEGKKKPFAIALSSDGRLCFAGYEDGRLARWTFDEKTVVAPLVGRHKKAVNAVVLSPDQSFVLTASRDKKAKLHDAAGRACLEVMPHGAEVWAADISPDSRFFATGTLKGELLLWRLNPAGQSLVTKIATHSFANAGVRSISFASTIPQLAVGLTDSSVRLMDFVADAPSLAEVAKHELKLQLFDPGDGRILIQAKHRDPELKLLQGKSQAAKTQNVKRIEECAHVLALTYDPLDKTLVAGTDLMGIAFIDLASKRQFVPRGINEKTFGRTTRVPALEFSSDGRTLFMGNGKQVTVLVFE